MSAVVEAIVHPVRGSTSLVLCDPRLTWVVDAGSVAVFGVRLEAGKPVGSRRFLFTCAVGDTLFGGVLSENPEQGLMVVGLSDSALREFPLDQLHAENPAALETALAGWIGRIGDVLRASTTAVHADPYEFGIVKLEAGQAAKPATAGLTFVRAVTGNASLAWISGSTLSPADGWIPIDERFPISVSEAAEIQFAPLGDIEATTEVTNGIARLHEFCFQALAARQAAEEEREARRLRESRRLLEVDTSDAVRGLLSLLTPDNSLPLRETPLLTALAALEPHVGCRFVTPLATDGSTDVLNSLDAVLQKSHIRMRSVTLPAQWWTRDGGPLLGYRGADRRPVALYRSRRWLGLFSRYILFDPVEQTRTPVTREVDETLAPEAISFVRPLPDEKTSSLLSLLRFTLSRIWREGILLLALSLLGAILGMLQPVATSQLIDKAIPEADYGLLAQMTIGLFAMAIGTAAFSLAQGLLSVRVSTLASSGLQAALFDRLLRLPQSFFRRFSTGDLVNRVLMVNEISNELNGAALTAILSGLMSFVNLFLCYQYSPQLAWIAMATALVTAAVGVAFSLPIRRTAFKLERLCGAHDGLSVQLVSGISKLRVSGSEQRAFNFWSRKYAEQLRLTDTLQKLSNWSMLATTAIDTSSLTFLFFFAALNLATEPSAVRAGSAMALTMGTFLAFYGAFNSLVNGAVSVTNKAIEIMDSWAKRALITPLLEAQPESTEGSISPGPLLGHVMLDRVMFRYQPEAPLILSGATMEIGPGEFAAIVGPSGCGKSTIFKLLLGFDEPESGKIYFDYQDLATLDKAAVRRQLGVVIQAGRINAGSVFDAIGAGSPITLDQAWEAARDAGFEDDLKSMPMGMHTVLPEGATTLSGGQRQRLLIARALVRNPRILLFDEATSALDNRTQEIVSRSLERRRVTRIVIAHRLSTIRDADRIFVLQNGAVQQSGTFDELIEQEGLFQRLAKRQMA